MATGHSHEERGTLVWDASRDHDAPERFGLMLCDKCGDMSGEIWLVGGPTAEGGASYAQRCDDCLAATLAQAVGGHAAHLASLLEYADSITLRRTEDGEEELNILHLSAAQRAKAAAYNDD